MTMNPSIALKEWASAIKALDEGKQIVLLRKGGIREETKHFQVESEAFYLFPTFEHQRKELLKPEYQHYVDETVRNWKPDQPTVTVTIFAELIEDVEIRDSEQLKLLQPYHIWTEHFAEERLKWKKKDPLHLLILRPYRLEKPLEIANLEQYYGCRSWIGLQTITDLHTVSRKPVWDEHELQRQAAEIKLALQG